MIRSVLSAVVLGSVLIMATPVFAGPAVAASETSPGMASSVDQPAPPATAEAPSTNMASPTGSGLAKGNAPVGFGWG